MHGPERESVKKSRGDRTKKSPREARIGLGKSFHRCFVNNAQPRSLLGNYASTCWSGIYKGHLAKKLAGAKAGQPDLLTFFLTFDADRAFLNKEDGSNDDVLFKNEIVAVELLDGSLGQQVALFGRSEKREESRQLCCCHHSKKLPGLPLVRCWVATVAQPIIG